MKLRKWISVIIVITMASLMLTGCSTKDKGFTIGVNQFVKHAALDASYQGFVDALADAGYVDGEKIKIDYQNAQGDQSNANTIATKLVNDNNDLILAIATPSAQAVANATKDIPVLVTAVTDPAGSGLVASNDAPGGNVSGTSDLTPIRNQIELLTKLVPGAKHIAILYCSSESNSKIQAEMAIEAATEFGLTSEEATVSNSNEIQQVVQSLVGKVDAIYAPTDNIIAAGMPTVAMVANDNGIPVICGEEGMVDAGGLATYGIDYYKLGRLTGEQAVKIIEGKADTATMPIQYLPDEEYALKINQEVADKLGITIPEELQ
ncbi:ABC transporter substrate-binding protein [Lachnospiraceae bacterium MD1]|jgi:putative ABC transport system substrate-binding protein|uniref:ABC transporter substrate-binding protein n=1 Tax=Variimorphobacter saccharofermentans TaxID=2755051 RepID=A0A839JV61_9FIRM|nr:ABC transporter substrate-binding protein [Variimorphobacter saccharofermentans]MBB2181286.1 ABC transporter substrate-binding protein [Variimorphobacter saccharofermentans]